MICGSMHFSREMLEAKKILEAKGHEVMVPDDVHDCLENPELNMDMEHCLKWDIDKKCFDKVAESDAIVVLNYPKHGMKGYIGGATLMEIGLARHLDKKIFLLHEPPSEKELRYIHEVKLTNPVILNGDFSRIASR